MVEVPSQISFEHMLAHMFPGFFTAITIFMILDLRSSLDISSYIFSDINVLIGFFSAILLGGTILGIIIDGIHHKFIEQMLFENHEMNGINDVKSDEIIKYFEDKHCHKHKQDCSEKKDCPFRRSLPYKLIKVFYLFDVKELNKYIEIYECHKKGIYHYYEFFANTFLAMIPFSFVAPRYLIEEVHIYWWEADIIVIFIVATELACLHLSLLAYKRYVAAIYFSFCRCFKSEQKDDEKKNLEFRHTFK